MAKNDDKEDSKNGQMENVALNEVNSFPDRKHSKVKLPRKIENLSNDEQLDELEQTKCERWFSRRNIYVTFYTVCLIGCIYQMAQVLILYFKYQTVTDLRIESPKYITPPSFSICFPYISLISFSRLFGMRPELASVAEKILQTTGEQINLDEYRMKYYKAKRGTFDWAFGLYLDKNVPLSVMLNATVRFNDLFLEGVAKSTETNLAIEIKNATQMKKLFEMKTYIKDENKCYVFKFKNATGKGYTYDMEKISNTYSYRDLLVFVRLNPEALSKTVEKAYMFFHPRKRLPRGRQDFPLTFKNPAENVVYFTSYERIYTTLLESPYESKCRKYVEEDYESQEDCVDKCVTKKSLEIYDRVPYTMLFDEGKLDVKVIGFKEQDDNKTIAFQLEQIQEICRSSCSQSDCELEVFRPIRISSEKGSNLKFEIDLPSSLDIITELNPSLTFLEYIIYNTSVFGFWFGLCIIQLADFIEYIKHKRRLAKKLAQKLHDRKRKEKTVL